MSREGHPCSRPERGGPGSAGVGREAGSGRPAGWSGPSWQAASGSALIALSVPVLVFIVLQRHFTRGLTAAAANG